MTPYVQPEMGARNAGPLAELTVLDLSQILAGPYCTMLLADLGARVLKVEKPGGDDARRMGPPFLGDDAAAFLAVNRGKESLVLDLKRGGGREALQLLLGHVDILVENFRPGALERLGIVYEALAERYPRLIYCSISGFGRNGPLAERGGFDLIAQGLAGLMSVTGELAGRPVKIGVPITDLTAGLYAALAILAALQDRARTGRGQRVESSLFEAGLSLLVWESASYWATGEPPEPLGTAHRLVAPYQVFPTQDGYLCVGAANQGNWERLCACLARPDLLHDRRFEDNAARMGNRAALEAALSQLFRQATTQIWLERLENAGVPAGPVNRVPEALEHPQAAARGMVLDLDHKLVGRHKVLGPALRLSRTPATARTAAPILGEHTRAVLEEYGASTQQLDCWQQEGALGSRT